MVEGASFWSALDELVGGSEVIVDRAKGSPHPRYPSVPYPLDYGHLEGTTASDRGGIDVWIGSGPRSEVNGVVCTVDLDKKDAEIKLLLGCTEREASAVLTMHNVGSQSAFVVERPPRSKAEAAGDD